MTLEIIPREVRKIDLADKKWGYEVILKQTEIESLGQRFSWGHDPHRGHISDILIFRS